MVGSIFKFWIISDTVAKIFRFLADTLEASAGAKLLPKHGLYELRIQCREILRGLLGLLTKNWPLRKLRICLISSSCSWTL